MVLMESFKLMGSFVRYPFAYLQIMGSVCSLHLVPLALTVHGVSLGPLESFHGRPNKSRGIPQNCSHRTARIASEDLSRSKGFYGRSSFFTAFAGLVFVHVVHP